MRTIRVLPLIALTLLFALASCGSDEPPSEATQGKP
jgi:hypothetical protein